jgi:heme/copper-type cytochrome/quinol oxidase subunit 4
MDVLFIAAAVATIFLGLVVVVGFIWNLWRLRRKGKSRKG